MRALMYAVVVLSFCAPNSQAQTTRSYDAIVVEDGAYIRSGGGEKYYPTGRLAKGQRVRVHRHDPGGWYQISPPEGSYSWIPKKYVAVIRPGLGEIKEQGQGAVAWVGTDFGQEASVFQRMLSKNEQVQIIGEGRLELDRDRGPEAMYKIKPPRGEYRWVPGRALIRADEARSGSPFENDGPARKPLNQEQFLGQRPKTRASASKPKPRKDTRVASREPSIDQARVNADLARLDQLDDSFRSIIGKDKREWDFEELGTGYVTLQKNAANRSIANQVAMRLRALKRYQEKKRRFDDFATLASATAQRDRDLVRMSSGMNGMIPPATEILGAPPRVYSASMPSGQESTVPVIPPQLPAANATPGNRPTAPRESEAVPKPPTQRPQPRNTVPVPQPKPPRTGFGNGKQSFPPPRNQGTVPIVTNQQRPAADSGKPVFDPPAGASKSEDLKPAPVPAGMQRSTVRRLHPKFVGAGVIMRSTELDVPEYVLLSPNGRILAYLEGVGSIDLSKHVNFAMGINKGDRFYNPKWKADFIRVRGVEPITFK